MRKTVREGKICCGVVVTLSVEMFPSAVMFLSALLTWTFASEVALYAVGILVAELHDAVGRRLSWLWRTSGVKQRVLRP